MQKPMLSVADLVAHMEEKGITFNITSEADATAYLHQNNNYFKLTSYRKNYSKYTSGTKAGKYENLDFAYLVELARIDVQLRHVILAMCLDIEHFLKVQLIRAVELAPGEDGYSIVADFVFDNGNQSFSERAKNASQRAHAISNKLEYNKSNPYCGGLISKYHDNLPVWAFVEIISFGDLLRFAEFVSLKIGWMLPADSKSLDRVRQIRNAAAHNNCIINDLTPVFNPGTQKVRCEEPVHITKFVRNAGVGKEAMRKKLSNRRFSQIIHLLYVFDKVVTSANSRQARISELKEITFTRMIQNGTYFKSNSLLESTYNVFSKVVKSLN